MPHTWTLEELRGAAPGLYSLPELRVAARRKGYRAIPQGTRIVLRDVETKVETEFESRVAAASFLGKQHDSTIQPDLDADLNSLLRMGWRGSHDSALGGGDFVPHEVGQLATQAVVDGKRAGVKVWVASDEAISELTAREAKAREAGRTEAADALAGEIHADTQLHGALRELEQQLGMAPNTMRAVDMGITQGEVKTKPWIRQSYKTGKMEMVRKKGATITKTVTEQGKRQVLIYDVNRANELRKRYAPAINQTLKVPVGDVNRMVEGLIGRKSGVEILSHPDPESAIIYAHLQNTQQTDAMLAGKVIDDPVTGRPYRVYPDEVKASYFRDARERVIAKGGIPCKPLVR